MYNDRSISVIVPAHNEQQAIGHVLSDLKSLRAVNGQPLVDEIIVCDNASTDATAQIVTRSNCTLVHEPTLGYGAACLAALAKRQYHDIAVFVDADCSVDVKEVPNLLHSIANGADLVIGSRTLGCAQRGSMTLTQRFGNALASRLIRWFWGYPVTDLGPFRAVTHNALQKIQMRDTRFGWTIEMQIRALQENLTLAEVPVSNRVRIGQSKISGTIRGVLGAAHGILGMIVVLLWRQHFNTGRCAQPIARTGK